MLERARYINWSQFKRWLPRMYVPHPETRAEGLRRYAVALGCTALALGLRMVLDPVLHELYSHTLFLLALIFVNWWCGARPALLVLVLGLLLSNWFFVPPRHTLLMDKVHWIGLGIYTVAGLAIIWFGRLVRQAQTQLEGQVNEIAKSRESLHHEIQERKQIEAALRQSEENFRATFQLSAVGQAQADPATGQLLRVNSQYATMTGYSEAELLQMRFVQLVHPEDRERCWAGFERLVRGEVPLLEIEERYVRKDGRPIYVSIAAAVIRDADGKPMRVAAVVQDVTPRRETEKALRQSEERFRTVVDSNMIGIAFGNPLTGHIYEANEAYLDIIGRTRGELRAGALNFKQYTPPEHAPADEASRMHLVRTLKPFKPYEKEYSRPDGSRVTVVLGGAPLDAPRCERAVVFALDITERKRLERELREREEEFRTSFELSAVGQAQVDPVAGRFLRVNSRYCRMTGYSVEEFPAMTFIKLLPQEEQEQCRREFERLVQGEIPVLEVGCRLIRKDGRFIYVEIAAALIRDASGQPLRVAAVIQDVTPRKETELALQRVQEQLRQYTQDLEARVAERTADLQQSVKSMQEFTYTIAHDLRAPLRAVHSFATLLLDHYGPRLQGEGKEFAGRIADSAVRMDHLIGDLLEYGRVASAEMPLGQVRSEQVVEVALRELRSTEAGARAQIEVERPLPLVRANAMLLRKALLNLLDNAVKFVAPGVMPRVWIGAEERNGWIRLCVRDNGVGIDPAFHDQIFRTFQRLAPSRFAGTGMGLAIVQKAVERMRGRLGVESEPGKGSCFWIELPKAGPG